VLVRLGFLHSSRSGGVEDGPPFLYGSNASCALTPLDTPPQLKCQVKYPPKTRCDCTASGCEPVRRATRGAACAYVGSREWVVRRADGADGWTGAGPWLQVIDSMDSALLLVACLLLGYDRTYPTDGRAPASPCAARNPGQGSARVKPRFCVPIPLSTNSQHAPFR